ncbi:MAG: alkaline phosphatase [Saprospiraceae bacterium]
MKNYMILICFILMQCSITSNSRNVPLSVTKETPKPGKGSKPLNVIFIIGDGMGLAQVSASMYTTNTSLALERCKVIGIHKSYSSDDLITDSAAGATAFSTGKKTKNGYLGVDSTGKSYETILEEASRLGHATGLVVSSTIVHATPAAFVSHVTNRDAYETIAVDLLDSGCDLMIGGGQKYFTRRTQDSLNLIPSLEKRNYAVSDYFISDYKSYQLSLDKKLMYFTADGDPLPASQGRDYMSKAAVDALNYLDKRNQQSFFIMVEGSQIDWGGHANDISYVLGEMKDFNSMLNGILDWAEKDGNTLVVITADHETGGLSILPGSSQGNLKTSFSTNKHTACLIPVYAFGPGAEQFSGIYENTEIYYKLKKALLE